MENVVIENQQPQVGTTGPMTLINCDAFENSFFFSMSLHRWGNRAKVKDIARLSEYITALAHEVEQAGDGNHATPAVEGLPLNAKLAANGATKTTKQLLQSEPLEALNQFLTETKTKICGPFGVASPSRVKEGLFVLAKVLVPQVEEMLSQAERELREKYLPAFLADYEAAKDRARTLPLLKGGLGPLYTPSDYPPLAELEEMFGVDWQWLSLSIPEDLPATLRAEQAEKFQRQMTDAAEEVKMALRVQLASFIENLTEKLTLKPGERPSIFRDSMIGNIAQFCEIFSARNVLNDTELAALVERSKALLVGVSPDKLRKYANVKENTREGFIAIQQQLSTMLETRQSRRFDLGE